MKRRMLVVFAITAWNVTVAQVALLDKAYDFLRLHEYEKAESALSMAEQHVTTANDARTYYLKAFLYKDKFVKAKEAERDVLREQCMSSIEKCKKLDVDGTYKAPVKQLNDFITASLFNDASELYNANEHQSCITIFKQYLKQTDSRDQHWLDANYFIASAYQALHEYDSAIRYLDIVKRRNYDQPVLFVDLAYLYLQKNDSTALQVIAEALDRYPDYYDLQITELNVLSAFSKVKKLRDRIEKFLIKFPDNIEVLLMAGTTYLKDTVGNNHEQQFKKAEAMYKRVIALDPLHYDGNYNLGVLYYNEAVDIVNKNDFDTDLKQLAVILEKSTVFFEQALPLLLKIQPAKKNDLKLLQALQAIYYNLNMKNELAEVNDLIKNLQKR